MPSAASRCPPSRFPTRWPASSSRSSCTAPGRSCAVSPTTKEPDVPGISLNLEVLVSRPAGSPLVRAYQERDPRAVAFYSGHFEETASYLAKAAEVDARFDRSLRARAASALVIPPGGDAGRLSRFVEDGGYMVTTGQQPGLCGGPLYNLYKGITALRLAGALEARLGKPVVPVFWIASEDHDWAEANHTHLVGVDNELHGTALDAPEPGVQPALHRIRVGPAASAALEDFVRHLPPTDFGARYVALLREAMAPEATLPSAFSRILQELLGPHGMYFTDAAHPVGKEASEELLLGELDRAAEMESLLASAGARLEAGGYAAQVPILEGGVNLFLEGPAGRERLFREGGAFRLRTSGERRTAAEVRARAAADPWALSPNVLLRPRAESAVFPTLSYVAGPGETAYYGQLADYFRAHGIRMPVVHPRLGATVVEGKIRKVMDKFGLGVDDLQGPFHELAGRVAREEVPDSVRAALGTLRGAIGKGVGELQDAVKAVDPTLKGTVQHVRSQAFSALEELERKVLAALKRENEIALTQLEKAQLHLFPLGKPQERVVNPFYFLVRYGGAFLDELVDRFEVNLR
ncbi:MAG: bacillithiol biosynthesis cysteine-adding enzyme BshC [Gemmatimonadetes bacterium]|nr:bacillithiol biosynthesis cysteine-adding enzyme BshC [Gemmatimonadota bacterium]